MTQARNATLLGQGASSSGTLGIAYGGTGATSASAARTALSAAASGANTDITSLQPGVSAPGLLGSSNNTVSAAGTTQGTATAITTDIAVVTTVAAGSGVVLPNAAGGKYAVVINRGANALNVYPASGHSFDGLAVNTPVVLPVNGYIELFGSSTSSWYTTLQAATMASMLQSVPAGVLKGSSGSLVAATAGTDFITPSGTETLTNKTLTTVALRETKVTMAANNIDLSTGNVFSKTISGATTLTISNVPAALTVGLFLLDLTNGGSATITWWSGVKWAGGTAPTLTASGRDVLGFFTHDGGTTWNGVVLGKAMA